MNIKSLTAKRTTLLTVAFNALSACSIENPIPWIVISASSFGVKELELVFDADGSSNFSAKSFSNM